MELIKSGDSMYEEYENLLLRRDQLQKESGQIWTAYTIRFGRLIADVFEEQLECVKCRKKIAYYQSAINHGGVIDGEAMRKYLDREMAACYAHLKRLQDDNNACKDAETSTAYEVQRSKTLYRRIAKLIHPDINPETDRNDRIMELWQRTVIAYNHNDVKELSELEVLVRRVLSELGEGNIRVEIPDIEEKIDALKTEIRDITRSEPYIYKDLLENEDAAEKKESGLEDELRSYKEYHQKLDEEIRKILADGGIRIQWQMN